MGLFGGSNKSDSAQGQSAASINSSGWVIGGGKASGGALSTTTGQTLPKGAIYSGAAVLLAWLYFKKKKGG